MKKLIKNYCEICVVCKRNKTSKHKSFEKLQTLFILEFKWLNLTMNLVMNLSINRNWNKIKYNSILMIIDRLIKMIHYILIIKIINVENLTEVFIKKIVWLHNLFLFIIIDRELLFISNFWSTFYYIIKIKKQLFIAFYFQTNEQIERQNNIMKQYFKVYVNFQQNNWIKLLFIIEFAYNNAKHVFTKILFFKVMLENSSKMTWKIFINNWIKLKSAKYHVKELNQLIIIFKKRLHDSQNYQVKYKNARIKVIKFQVENYVYLNEKNIRIKRNRKLK